MQVANINTIDFSGTDEASREAANRGLKEWKNFEELGKLGTNRLLYINLNEEGKVGGDIASKLASAKLAGIAVITSRPIKTLENLPEYTREMLNACITATVSPEDFLANPETSFSSLPQVEPVQKNSNEGQMLREIILWNRMEARYKAENLRYIGLPTRNLIKEEAVRSAYQDTYRGTGIHPIIIAVEPDVPDPFAQAFHGEGRQFAGERIDKFKDKAKGKKYHQIVSLVQNVGFYSSRHITTPRGRIVYAHLGGLQHVSINDSTGFPVDEAMVVIEEATGKRIHSGSSGISIPRKVAEETLQRRKDDPNVKWVTVYRELNPAVDMDDPHGTRTGGAYGRLIQNYEVVKAVLNQDKNYEEGVEVEKKAILTPFTASILEDRLNILGWPLGAAYIQEDRTFVHESQKDDPRRENQNATDLRLRVASNEGKVKEELTWKRTIDPTNRTATEEINAPLDNIEKVEQLFHKLGIPIPEQKITDGATMIEYLKENGYIQVTELNKVRRIAKAKVGDLSVEICRDSVMGLGEEQPDGTYADGEFVEVEILGPPDADIKYLQAVQVDIFRRLGVLSRDRSRDSAFLLNKTYGDLVWEHEQAKKEKQNQLPQAS